MRLDTSYCDLGVQGAQKGSKVGSGASGVHFGENFIKQKLQGTPKLVGVGHLRQPKSRSGRTWAQCDSLEGQCLAIPTYFWYHTRLKNFNTIFNTYFESSRATPGNPS